MVGIYKITNPEGKSYIGLSKDIEKRFKSHKGLQFKGNNKLRESLTKYGGDSHLFEILEEIDISSITKH
jgi:group I intron endonuclease